MTTATLTSQKQITIPLEVRIWLNLQKGDRVFFSLDKANDTVTVVKAPSTADSFGVLARYNKKINWKAEDVWVG